MIFEVGGIDKEDVGFYSGLIVRLSRVLMEDIFADQ